MSRRQATEAQASARARKAGHARPLRAKGRTAEAQGNETQRVHHRSLAVAARLGAASEQMSTFPGMALMRNFGYLAGGQGMQEFGGVVAVEQGIVRLNANEESIA